MKMKVLYLICAAVLFIGIANLPVGYYTFLRIVVTVGSVMVFYREIRHGFNFWVIIFGLLAVLFNPIIPVYLNEKSAWIPIDFIAGVLFLVKTFMPSGEENNRDIKN
jgi:hypothetical protein